MEKSTIEFDGVTITMPTGGRILRGNTEFYLVTLLQFEVVYLRQLLAQIQRDPTIHLKIGGSFKIESLLQQLEKLDLPEDFLNSERDPILMIEDDLDSLLSASR